MTQTQALKQLLANTLNINTDAFEQHTPLLGSIAELDSMGVLKVILEIENKFSISLSDDEIDTESFESFGSLLNLITSNLPVSRA